MISRDFAKHFAREWIAAWNAHDPDLHFGLLGVFVGSRSVALGIRNQKGRLSVETFEIGDTARVTRAAAHHA